MRIFQILAICTVSLVLLACGENQNNDEMAEAALAGPEFDLLETPVGVVNFPTGCNAQAAPRQLRVFSTAFR